jgi:hypothetical protein
MRKKKEREKKKEEKKRRRRNGDRKEMMMIRKNYLTETKVVMEMLHMDNPSNSKLLVVIELLMMMTMKILKVKWSQHLKHSVIKTR